MTLLIRSDASVSIGTGHVMRCLALAQAWQDEGGRVIFAITESTPALDKRLGAEGIDVVHLEASPGSDSDANWVVKLAGEQDASWIVVDGYQFAGSYQRAIKSAGHKLCFIDDNGHAEDYSADIVLNHNAHAREGLYPHRASHTELLLGPKYALLRREFRRWRTWQREIPTLGTKLLVTVGGSDPNNVTLRVIEALQLVKVKNLQVVVVVGGSNPNAAVIERASHQAGQGAKVVFDVNNMPELLAWADVAIAAAGIVSWEICALALPAILFPAAPNQEATADHLRNVGAARVLPEIVNCSAIDLANEISQLLGSFEDRKRISETANQLVDGSGCERVVAALHRAAELPMGRTSGCRA
jgi:UDP-2,4-diacetamido-2,4,6-trideoxy-beta-L-altropyranose hydrolase